MGYYDRLARGDWREDHHPACPRGCGELADECACPPARRNPLGSMTTRQPVKVVDVYDDDFRPACRWRGCTEDAERGGYCDPHLGTL
jgi:hypothetical protein